MLLIPLMGINFDLGAVEPHDLRSSTDSLLTTGGSTGFGYELRLAWRFTPTADINVTHVGAIMKHASGIDEGYKFALYSLTGVSGVPTDPAFASSADFSIGDPIGSDEYLERTVALSAPLVSGTTYALVAFNTNTDDRAGELRSMAVSDVGEHIATQNHGVEWLSPTTNIGGPFHMFIESNTAIPEPSTYLTLGSMLLTLAVMKRRKKSVA